MTDKEFIEANVGKPWVNRGSATGSHDCWSLVVAYFLDVRGIELPPVDGFADGSCSIGDGFLRQVEHWQADDAGVVFMAFLNGAPCHVGLRFGRHVLHAVGSPESGGQVCYHPLRLVKRWYTDMQFFTFKES